MGGVAGALWGSPMDPTKVSPTQGRPPRGPQVATCPPCAQAGVGEGGVCTTDTPLLFGGEAPARGCLGGQDCRRWWREENIEKKKKKEKTRKTQEKK